MEHKRELIYEMSKWPDRATEVLQSWSRLEILQILCAELGKERKYTGLTKSKLIESLLKIVCGKRSLEPETANITEGQPSSENGERTLKKQRKSDHPNHLPSAANGAADVAPDTGSGKTMHCKNSACKAKMNHEDVFCKRCSCCICRKYDDNKDPSLWLNCNSDAPFRGLSCGMSCHLECALQHENYDMSQARQDKGLDGSFRCVSCGKVNDLLSCWRKQLLVAKDTRRVDTLCYRLSLSQKILCGTKQYQHLYKIIDEAVKKLEEDVGPLTGLPVKKARGIVNRLSSAPEIQRLCASALESVEVILSTRVFDMPSGCNILGSKLVKLDDMSASSVTVILNSDDSNIDGCSLWHRKADDTNYSAVPTCRLFQPNTTKFLLSGLTPATQYVLKVVALNKDREAGFTEFRFRTQDKVPNSKSLEAERSESLGTNCSSLCDPSSVEDEVNENRGAATNSSDQSQKQTTITGDVICLLREKYNNMAKTSCIPNTNALVNECCTKKSSYRQMVEDTSTENGFVQMGLDSSKAVTPWKPQTEKPQAGSCSKKRSGGIGGGDEELEYDVKVIRWLEREGHVETSFRQKFLTWYALTATPQEVRVVKLFIDTFVEDPDSLAAQLLHSFSDLVSDKRCSTVPAGFCTKLWH